MENGHRTAVTGSHGAYQWLTTWQHDLDTLLQRCPQAVVGKYVTVTSLDSGAMALTDAEERDGWQSRNEIAYSPKIQSTGNCRTERSPGGCAGFNEWYVSNSPFNLGEIWHGNVFEAPITPGQVSRFVNFGRSFALHDPEMATLVSLFVSATRTPSCKDSRRNAMLRDDQALKEGLDEVAKAAFRAGT